MKLISKDVSFNSMLLGDQQINTYSKYRLSYFCYLHEFDGNFALWNNLTKRLYLLTEEEYKSLSQSEIEYNSNLNEMIKEWIVFSLDVSEATFFDQLYNINSIINKKDGLNHFVILTTTDCNARCFYCYENGVVKKTMSEKTAEDVADFIIKNSNGSAVKIKWFGGEPLLNTLAMDIILNKLSMANIEYKCSITTNGLLFNSENVKKAASVWNITKVQITLDGTENVYNRIKNYVQSDGTNPFNVVIANIKNLLENNIKVDVRLNLGDHNKEDLFSLCDYLASQFEGDCNLLVYVASLFDLDGSFTKEKILKNYKDFVQLDTYLLDKKLKRNNLNKLRSMVRSCMASNKSSVVIAPDGGLGKCEHFSDGEKMYGSIYSQEINKNAYDYWFDFTVLEECKKCIFYPNCAGDNHCPNKKNCRPNSEENLIKDFYLRSGIECEVRRYLIKNK